ncbi:MAG: hypothetical protein IJ302_09575, partial [Clostridia bacterium]|nr:hypothetical protein [Clostridia bacterium]
MTRNSRIISVLMLASVLLAAVGCGETSADSGESTGTAAGETTAAAEETTENIYAHSLGDYDFGGETFTMYTRNNLHLNDNLHSEAADGTTLNDAIYERNIRLMEQYNFKFAEVREDGDTAQARLAVMAGEDTYDIIQTRCVFAFNYALEGLLRPVADLPEIDLSKPYWDRELTDAMSIGNEPFFAVGAYNTSGYEYTHLLAFNKELAATLDYSDIYQTVTDGKWTFSVMQEMMKNAVSDINGDGTMDASDRYGLLSSAKQILPCFWIAAGQDSMKMDANDYPTFSMLTDEAFQSLFVEIFDIVYDSNVWLHSTLTDNVIPEQATMFINGQSLFIDMPVFYLETLRAMDTDFGLVPYPKYDEAQGEYLSRIEGCEQTCIPVTNVARLEMTGVILEAMASDSAQNLVPAFYETLLKTKYARDNDSEAMLEIVFGNRVFDWGDTFWCDNLRDTEFQSMFKADDRSLASRMAKVESKLNQLIEDMKTALAKLDK